MAFYDRIRGYDTACSCINNAQNARSAYRNWRGPGLRRGSIGFRCMSLVKPEQAERVSASTSEPRDEAAEKRRSK